MYDLPPIWDFFLLLGFILTAVGFLMKLNNPDHGTVPSTEGLAGELTCIVGIVICGVIATHAPRPHNPATCVACSTDQQQMSRPSYDWAYQEIGEANGS